MRKIIYIIVFFCLGFAQTNAQFGIGAAGGMIYPGFSSSENHGSQFAVGAGFDLMVRHTLFKISEDLKVDAKYYVSNFYSDIDLSRIGLTRFIFNYLSLDVQIPLTTFKSLIIAGGAGISLVNVKAENYIYYELTETLFSPNINTSIEYWFSKNFNIFLNMHFQFGEFSAKIDVLRVHGIRMVVGGTMFLTE